MSDEENYDNDHYQYNRDRTRREDRRRERDYRDRDYRDGRDGRDMRERGDSEWRDESLSNTILVKSIPDHTEESDLHALMDEMGISVRDIRLISRKGTRGASFAFIEFHTVEAASRWMQQQQGILRLSKDHVSGLVYSRKTPAGELRQRSTHDWECPNPRCCFNNFAKRDRCFKCDASRDAVYPDAVNPQYSMSHDDGSAQVGVNPCNTVIVRGLDALTTEASLLASLAAITSLEPKNCYVMRDFVSGVSLGYAFMEFDSVANGRRIREYFSAQQAFEVDGKLVMVDYAKNTYSTILASIQYANTQLPAQPQQPVQPTQYEQQALAASLHSQTGALIQASSKLNQNGEVTPSAQSRLNTTPSQSALSATRYSSQQWPDPDVSQYQFEPTSGYYYDPLTALYYDPNTQYYYDGNSRQFLFWEASTKTYQPVPQNGGQNPHATNPALTDETKKEEQEKKEKAAHAKKIAKEMEKWAKVQSKKSKGAAPAPQPAPVAELPRDTNMAADAAYEVLLGSKASSQAKNEDKFLMPPPPSSLPAAKGATRPPPPTALPSLVASYDDGGDDSDQEEEDDPLAESKLVDFAKLMCLLCERKFQSREILEKHTRMSDLHMKNLESLKQKHQVSTAAYRDRAKERRQKFGSAPPVQNKTLAPAEAYDQLPLVTPSDNKGSNLLRKMGWSDGQGLGKTGQGRVEPVEAKFAGSTSTAGLGSTTRNTGIQPGDTYRDAVKKTLYARYAELE